MHSKEYNLYGKDKVIKGGKGFAQGIWPYTRRSGNEVWRRMKSGVGLCFVRNLEQGKPTLRMDKVNQLLDLFNYELTATKKQ